MTRPVTLAIIGAGKRGEAYAEYATKHPDLAKVVAVAEPRDFHRDRMAREHGVPLERTFRSWEEVARQPRLADAALICTQDRMHLDPLLALAPKGYALLLEKPMGVDPETCERIAACVRTHGNLFAVCHVLLYTDLTVQLRELVRGGAIGDLVSLQHLEPVGWWHQAHSFVRGNWRNESEASFMLLAKSCHDIDWIRHFMGRRCSRVSSFGTLRHFRASEAPEGAADRCLDCAVEGNCPYSAKRFYLDHFGRNSSVDYCVGVITDDFSPEGVEKALREGPYGRCVYACDNDVVDHQVVNFQFEDGATAVFTMTAFTRPDHRKTRLFGTRGMIETDGVHIRKIDFVTEEEEVIDTSAARAGAGADAGHGGGDYRLMEAFVKAVAENDSSPLHSGLEASLESHRIVFAAERSRRENRVVELP